MDLDRDAKRILDLTREARTPSAEDKERIGRRLAGALAFGATSAHAGTAATTKVVGTTWIAKWAVVATVAAAGGAGYIALHPKSTPAPVTVATIAPGAPEAAAVDKAVEPTDAPSPVAVSDESAAASDGEPHRPAPVKPSTPRATLSDELDLLHEAQAKWRAGNAAAALAVIAEHRARFPHSALGPERDALAVLSLCATNRVGDAKRLARHFLATASRSPLRTSVEESCGGRGEK